MQRLIYLIAYPILLIISILPFRILYILSDFVFFFVYYVFGYRKKVVRENLALALPHLSAKERLVIEKKSYSHLCDMFLEMIKTMGISNKEIDKRFVFKNLEVYKSLEKEGKSIALMCSHYASYEWVISMNSKIEYEGYALYKPIQNKYFDNLVRKIRSKFKAHLLPIDKSILLIDNNFHKNIKSLYGFASDQSPIVRLNTYWTKFMDIEVPVYVGAEMLSKKFDMNVIFLKVKKLKRGFYEAEFEIISTNVKEVPNFGITDMYLRKVEDQIMEAPEYYFWTHNRWKHKDRNPKFLKPKK
ncbi:lysophospholipid acyltransferase family protein [Flavobacterium hercynium]|uniref:Lipid A biosynthesis acyltransferase n=1 Tax=Flavobacterium hercynium TaxID=387094 RepID=A0A226HSN5_9FLAO|nr:lysophospholipid acyltransferase family protein [Flavobacterium hercynium]OXA97293.1 lipid A biosynthesis acyltransferase [Flavobacterium hercynium]SMP18308.1 KDO2-lipid IV(A) lauroyltransferase [Flavobacterium hercynium]